jgi:hypothetical protein
MISTTTRPTPNLVHCYCAGPAAAAVAAAAGPGAAGMKGVAGGPGHHLAQRVDAAYFDSYSYFDIHHEMLSDKVSKGFWGGGTTRHRHACGITVAAIHIA